MSNEADLKKERVRGYSAGYAAGKKAVTRHRSFEHARRERQAFYDRAFIASLYFAFTQHTWTLGKKAINTLAERVNLASDIAAEALKQRKYVSGL